MIAGFASNLFAADNDIPFSLYACAEEKNVSTVFYACLLAELVGSHDKVSCGDIGFGDETWQTLDNVRGKRDNFFYLKTTSREVRTR